MQTQPDFDRRPGRPDPRTIDQREAEASERERQLAEQARQVERLRASVEAEVHELAVLQRRAASHRALPEVAEPVPSDTLAALSQLREDSLHARDEAAAQVERRLSALEQHLAVTRELTQHRLAAVRALVVDGPNRRIARRVSLVTHVDLHSDANFFSGFSADLSTGGLFVATVEHAPIGSMVALHFTLPEGVDIQAEGEVRWVREVSEVQPELPPGVGVAFTAITPESLAAIERFIAGREPMFLPEM